MEPPNTRTSEKVAWPDVVPTRRSGRTNLSEEADKLTAVFRKTGEVFARVRNQAIKLKNQQPLRLLAMLAGIAGIAGAVTRLWRSSRDE
jgi:hypothetical protein